MWTNARRRIVISCLLALLLPACCSALLADEPVRTPSDDTQADRVQALEARLRAVERRLDALERVHPDAGRQPTPQSAEHAAACPFEGTWVRSEGAKSDMPKVVIARVGDGWTIRAWGDCHPTDCDWGTTNLHLLADSVASQSFSHGFAKWDPGFKDSYMVVHLEGDFLVAEHYSIYTDGSGRSNTRRVSRLERAAVGTASNEPDIAEGATNARERGSN